MLKSFLVTLLIAGASVSTAHAQPVVHNMGVDDEPSFQAFKSALLKSAFVSTDFSLDPNPRMVASITATMVFVSNNPLATSQEINDFLHTYSDAIGGYDSADPDLNRSSSFFAAVRGMDRGSPLFTHQGGLDTRVSNRVFEALDISVPPPLDASSTVTRMVEFENARVRSFTNSPDWSLILTLALYGQDIDGNKNDFVSGIIENYLVSEGFAPVPINPNSAHYQPTFGSFSTFPVSYSNYIIRTNQTDPNNIDASEFQNRIEVAFMGMRSHATGLINDISGTMQNNPPSVIDAATNSQDSIFVQQQIDIYEQDLLNEATGRATVNWNSMILLQDSQDRVQRYSTTARSFSAARLDTDETLARTKLGIEIAGNVADALKEGSIGSATSALLGSIDLADGFGLFGDTQAPEDQIFDQILLVRQDIDNMRVEMHDRFDRVEEQLGQIYMSMNVNFNLIGNQIGDLQTSVDILDLNIAENHAVLERIEDALYGMIDDLLFADFAQLVDAVLNYRSLGADLNYNADSPNFLTGSSSIKTFNVTNAANTTYAGPNTSLLTSFDQAQSVLSGASIGRNINDLRTFPSSLGLSQLLPTRVVATAPWTQSASAYVQFAHESPWYFAYMYENEISTPGNADLISITEKGEQLRSMMVNGRNPSLFDALLDGYSNTITELSVIEDNVMYGIYPDFDIIGGLTQPDIQWGFFPPVPRLENADGNLSLPFISPNWNIFLADESLDGSEKDIAPISYALILEAANDIGVSPTVSYTWNALQVGNLDVFMFIEFTVDGNGGVPSRGLKATTVRELHFRVLDTNGTQVQFFNTHQDVRDFFLDNPMLWDNLATILISDENQEGQDYLLTGGPFGDLTGFEFIADRSSSSSSNTGRVKSLELMQNLQVEAWQAMQVNLNMITTAGYLADWAALLEAYATLSMPDMIAESTVASSALRGMGFGPASQVDPTIIDYRDSFSIDVDMLKSYERNEDDPANFMLADDRLRPNLVALSDSIDIWIVEDFPGHSYINYVLSELHDLQDFAFDLAIDDRYLSAGVLDVSEANGLLSNDVDQEFRTIEVASYTTPTSGEVVVNPDGSFVYTPGGDFHVGTASFEYTAKALITENNGQPQYFESNSATVVIDISPWGQSFIAVPADCPTVALAIDRIIDDPNSVIELAPGTYNELINTQGKAFTLRSASGNSEDTIISGAGLFDPDGYQRVVTINSGEGRDTVIQGITIRDGRGGFIYPFAGAGMLITDAEPTVRGCIFINNFAFSLGGGIAISGSKTALIENCLFYDNSGQEVGGGAIGTFEFLGSPGSGAGDAVILNCTFSGNNSHNGSGGAIFFDALSTNSIVSNSVLWGNTPDQIVGSGFEVRYSVIQDGVPAGIIDGGGNLSVDPLLIDPDPFGGGDFRVDVGSPAIDAGDNTQPGLVGIVTDLDGNPRFIDDLDTVDTGVGPAPIIDMGAYEFQYIAPPCPADFTGDGIINFFDISVFLQLFGAQDPEADFTDDGIWNFFDVSAFLQAFTAGCP